MSVTKHASLQRIIRQECIDVVGMDFLHDLYVKSARNFLFTSLHLWLAILAAFALAILAFRSSGTLSFVIWLPLAFFIGTRINALNVQVHEGSHGLLTDSRYINDLLCNWLAGYPTFYDVDQYAAVHISHHQYLNEKDDPEQGYYRLPPSRWALLGCFLKDFFWITLVQRVFTIKRALSSSAKTSWKRMLAHVFGRLVWMIIMIGALSSVLGLKMALLFYVLFWLVPLFSVYPMLIRLRQVAEHYDPAKSAEHTFVARTTRTHPVEHYLLGAQMEYHFEHHLFPLIPYANLRCLHGRLQEAGFFQASQYARVEHSLSQGYLHFWRHVILPSYAASGNLSR